MTFRVNDGLADSAVRTATVSVTATNDAPTVDLDSTQGGTGSTATFTEDGAAASLAPNAAVADVDSASLASATITLTNRPDGTAESLAVTSPAATRSPPRLQQRHRRPHPAGPATRSQFQTVLSRVTYANSDQDPDTTAARYGQGQRGSTDSNVATATVTVIAVNDAPAST